jgi:hypothetical protein
MRDSLLPLLLIGLLAATAPAAVTAVFNQEDPGSTLPGYVSNTWDVGTGTDPWLSAELLVELTNGDIYQDPAGTDAPPNPANFGSNPTLEYDSYMTGGTDSEAPSTTGPLPSVIGGAVDIGGGTAATFDTSLIDVTWASSLATNPAGDLMLVRVTLSTNAQGTFKYRLGVDNLEPIIFLDGLVVGGAMLPTLPGDFNGDGSVDTADYTIWADNYTGSGGTGGTPSTGDANGDGAVDTADYTIWADNYTGSSVSVGAVPEPGTATLLLLLGALGLAVRRR